MPAKQPKRGRLWFNDGSCVRLRPAWKDHVWARVVVIGLMDDLIHTNLIEQSTQD